MSAEQSHEAVPAPALGDETVAAWATYNDGSTKPPLEVSLPYETARLSAAYHEAGHAVVTAAYGAHIKVTGVLDLPLAPGETGWSLTGRTEFDGPPIPFWRIAAQSAVGERAQIRYLKSAGFWSPQAADICSNHDDYASTAARFHAMGLTLAREDDGACDMAWATACRMADLLLTLLWPQVRAVASGINAHGLVTGDEAADLAGGTNPAPYNTI